MKRPWKIHATDADRNVLCAFARVGSTAWPVKLFRDLRREKQCSRCLRALSQRRRK